jgi:hypothetical protein
MTSRGEDQTEGSLGRTWEKRQGDTEGRQEAQLVRLHAVRPIRRFGSRESADRGLTGRSSGANRPAGRRTHHPRTRRSSRSTRDRSIRPWILATWPSDVTAAAHHRGLADPGFEDYRAVTFVTIVTFIATGDTPCFSGAALSGSG